MFIKNKKTHSSCRAGHKIQRMRKRENVKIILKGPLRNQQIMYEEMETARKQGIRYEKTYHIIQQNKY